MLILGIAGCYAGSDPAPRETPETTTTGLADPGESSSETPEPPPLPGTSSSSSTTGPDETTGLDEESTSTGSSSTTTGLSCPAESDCFFLDGVFHTADADNPTAIYDIDLPADTEYGAIEVELDVTHGGWYPDDPAGLHNIFWLHRGRWGDFTWMGGVAGYVNARGPGNNIIRTRHDLDVASLDDSRTFNINGVALQEDVTYHVFYRYDAVAGIVTVRITDDGEVVAEGTDPATTDLVRNNDGGFFIWFANGTDVEQPGPEVPSLGWSFADLRVEFVT